MGGPSHGPARYSIWTAPLRGPKPGRKPSTPPPSSEADPMCGQGDRVPPSPVDEPTRLLGRRYRAALLSVALLVLLNQLLVQPPILRLTTDAPVINVAG